MYHEFMSIIVHALSLETHQNHYSNKNRASAYFSCRTTYPVLSSSLCLDWHHEQKVNGLSETKQNCMKSKQLNPFQIWHKNGTTVYLLPIIKNQKNVKELPRLRPADQGSHNTLSYQAGKVKNTCQSLF